jgi:hypothetical protein
MFARASCLILCVLGLLQGEKAERKQPMPEAIVGTWIVSREIPTRTISCWGKEDAKKVIRTELQYSDKVFRWDKTTIENPVVDVRTVTAQEFHDENSGAGPHGAEISLQELGINSDSVTEISVKHSPGHLFTDTSEIPGDDVVVKDPATIVFSVCNVYFEAKRVHKNK